MRPPIRRRGSIENATRGTFSHSVDPVQIAHDFLNCDLATQNTINPRGVGGHNRDRDE